MTIIGSGHHVPGRPFTNDDLARVMDTSDEWIRPRSGIAARHFAEEGQGVSQLARPAAERALTLAGVEASAVDYIIFGTMTPDFILPGSGGLLGAELGIPGVPALDIRQQCAFFPFAVQVADALMTAGVAETILICGANAHAGFMPWDWKALREGTESDPELYRFATQHRATAVLFGDGAGALLCRPHARREEGYGLLGSLTHTDGSRHDHFFIPAGGFTHYRYWEVPVDERIPSMRGRELFKCAVQRLPQVVRELCERAGVSLDDVDWFVAHQANDRINAAVVQALGVSPDKVPSNIAHFGNTSDATIPILMDELLREERVRPGDLVCFLGLGAGLNWGAAMMRL
ncbi:MAG TPA: 3-oxoacyl-[acyl-carrier-protein] synthase III C-terminal domain-containing protein [Sandaracinaceae bacterium LLY-WYZ-13_1]|nr:3-oxoacyl-[acyl-carrier-protein] synthase III C-terminal domain-containing protein [Sandaracinaceae bacterium LLY-WYZ-13_1]